MKVLDRVLQKWRIGMVRPHVRTGARVLDIGSAHDGQLFLQVPGIGAFVGIDPDIEANHDIASNARLLRGHFPQALESGEPFDVITMLAVLEHVPPPEQKVLAANCARHLVPGGKVILTVPSPAVDAILAMLRFVGLVDGMTLEQHYGFKPSQARRVFEDAGLRMVHHRRFQTGLNNLFVFEKRVEDGPTSHGQASRGLPASIMRASTIILMLLATTYVSHGIFTIWRSDGTDLHKRRIEQLYVLKRQNPYDVSETSIARSRGQSPPSHLGRHSEIDPNIGIYGPGGYPPWSFLAGFLFVFPGDVVVTKAWYVILSLVALGIAGRWAYLLGKPYGPGAGAFVASACMAIFAQGSTLRLGQYGIIVNGLLIAVWWAEERRSRLGSGLAYALALVKPNTSALFGWPLVWRRNYLGIGLAAVLVCVMSVVVGAIVHTSPFEMVSQMARQSDLWVSDGVGLVGLLVAMGAPSGVATASLALAGMALSGVLTWLRRDANLLVAFAIAAVIGRLWSYHRQYDDLMLMFPLAQLALLWLERRSIGSGINFLLLGATLWAPLRFVDLTPRVQGVLIMIWVYTLAVILWTTRLERTGDQPASAT